MNKDRGDETVMIFKMKDHEIFLPKNAAGKTAIVYGNAEIEKITSAKYEVEFIVAGVIIK